MAGRNQETHKLQLLYVWASPFAQRVQIALALKGIEYEKLPQDLSQKSPLLLASNPVYKKIPVLLHGDRAICESSIIIQYIDEAFHDHHHHQFLPEDAYGRATARFWADFVDKKIFEGLFGILKSHGEEAQQAAAIENALACFETLDEALGKVSGGFPFFGGEKMGFVDIVFAPFVCWYPAMEAATEGFKFPFQEKYPHLHAWLDAFRKSSVASVLPEPQKIIDFSINFMRKRAVSST